MSRKGDNRIKDFLELYPDFNGKTLYHDISEIDDKISLVGPKHPIMDLYKEVLSMRGIRVDNKPFAMPNTLVNTAIEQIAEDIGLENSDERIK
jgi:hypothetical protein